MKKLFKKIVFIFSACWLMTACVEPYQLETRNFESALVIQATITNELKNQEIGLSKTYRFEENGPTFESGAEVYIMDNLGNNYPFEEQGEKYVSTTPFQAEAGKTYLLNILTADGKNYRSTPQNLTTTSLFESLTPSVVTNSDGVRGVQIGANSVDPTGNSKYYRYTYEETYKIIAPFWSLTNLTYSASADDFEFLIRQGESKTCYSTVASNDIIQTTTNDLSEDRVSNFPVRFISDQNGIISHRYSILVKQYVQSLEAYTFYKTMKELSGSGSLLSQNQPGFFYGNIKRVENPNEKVIGFFEVVTVSEKRVFFNYAALFAGEPLPPYLYDCDFLDFDISILVPSPQKSPKDKLIIALATNELLYFALNGTTYSMVFPPCSDCTSFSSNVIPSFWED